MKKPSGRSKARSFSKDLRTKDLCFKDLWVNPRSNIRRREKDRAWSDVGNITPDNAASFLELADKALGHKSSVSPEKKIGAKSAALTSRKIKRHSI